MLVRKLISAPIAGSRAQLRKLIQRLRLGVIAAEEILSRSAQEPVGNRLSSACMYRSISWYEADKIWSQSIAYTAPWHLSDAPAAGWTFLTTCRNVCEKFKDQFTRMRHRDRYQHIDSAQDLP